MKRGTLQPEFAAQRVALLAAPSAGGFEMRYVDRVGGEEDSFFGRTVTHGELFAFFAGRFDGIHPLEQEPLH